MTRKYFGTDGIRGTVGQFPITIEFAQKLGFAAGMVFGKAGAKNILLGKDTRISGYMLESALESGLVAAGMNVQMLGPIPTPAIAYLTKTFKGEAGIVISASHNPFQDNGIKFFSNLGTKIADELEEEIEALLEQPINMVQSEYIGRVSRINDAAGRYVEFCKSTFNQHLDLSNLKIVLDCANGAAYKVAPMVFQELGAKITTIGNNPNGVNINLNCGSTHMEALQAKVLEEQADIGIAFDGDADRVLMVDSLGNVVDGDDILYIIARDLKNRGKLHNSGVVGTLMSNMALELALQKMDIAFIRANVGDRYVMEKLAENGWFLGGENSGHIVDLNYNTTGDGIIAALQVLKALKYQNQTLTEALRDFVKFPQTLENIRTTNKPDTILQQELVQKASTEVDELLAGKGRLLLRKSGTEPLVRVMVEAADKDLVQQCILHMKQAILEVDK